MVRVNCTLWNRKTNEEEDDSFSFLDFPESQKKAGLRSPLRGLANHDGHVGASEST
jgi:hypothetical protein